MIASMRQLSEEQEMLIVNLLAVADDRQADTIDELMVAAGYWWHCEGHGYFRDDQRCDVCGSAPTQE